MKFSFYGWLVVFLSLINISNAKFINVFILTQNFSYELEHAQKLKRSLQEQENSVDLKIETILTHEYFNNVQGIWAIWPILRRLSSQQREAEWTMFYEPYIEINVKNLIRVLNEFNPNEDLFISRSLHDQDPVIIHHFYGFDGSYLNYPDFAAGIVISRSLLIRLTEKLNAKSSFNDFSIDPKFELAKLVLDLTNIRLTNTNQFCILPGEEDLSECATIYREPNYFETQYQCGSGISNDDVFFGVKTFTPNHRSRLVYVKRTWGKLAKFIEYFSDLEDPYVPTIDLGIPNTKHGHCSKTFAILKHFLVHKETANVSWVVIADDDTLLSTPRLYRLLNCLPKSQKLIVGERYGYGFSTNGLDGYDYPTGGAGSAAKQIVDSCNCPSDDSPDDMIIGMCARRLSIPIIHSAAFHQARPIDYDSLYVNRIKPISFHKFEELDPYEIYMKWLHESMPDQKIQQQNLHEKPKKNTEL